MCFTYDEYAEVYIETIRKARKPHRCRGCYRDVLPGEQYQQTESLFDGAWDRFALCNLCTQDRVKIHMYEIEEGCSDHESWCCPEEIDDWIRGVEACGDLPFSRSNCHIDLKQLMAAVQADFQMRWDNERERREQIRAEMTCKPQN